MLSNLASYLFGSASDEDELNAHGVSRPEAIAAVPDTREEMSEEEEEWVMVGGSAAGSALTLGALGAAAANAPLVVPVKKSGSAGSTPFSDASEVSSTTGEEDADVDMDLEGLFHESDVVLRVAPPRSAVSRRAPAAATTSSSSSTSSPGFCPAASSLAQARATRAAQRLKVAHESKGLTAKAVERRNKAVMSNQGSSCSKKASALRNGVAFKAGGYFKQLKQC